MPIHGLVCGSGCKFLLQTFIENLTSYQTLFQHQHCMLNKAGMILSFIEIINSMEKITVRSEIRS